MRDHKQNARSPERTDAIYHILTGTDQRGAQSGKPLGLEGPSFAVSINCHHYGAHPTLIGLSQRPAPLGVLRCLVAGLTLFLLSRTPLGTLTLFNTESPLINPEGSRINRFG